MNREDIIRMAKEAGFERLGHTDKDWVCYPEDIERFAEMIVSAEQLELPEPRLTGKFSFTAGKFKCTGCTGTWTNREDAKHHSCKDYQ